MKSCFQIEDVARPVCFAERGNDGSRRFQPTVGEGNLAASLRDAAVVGRDTVG